MLPLIADLEGEPRTTLPRLAGMLHLDEPKGVVPAALNAYLSEIGHEL